MLSVSEPMLGEDEKIALTDVLDSNWITMGNRVQRFEEAFAAEHGAAAGVAVSSCTAGLHLALVALGIGPGDEVLVPSLSFVATANAVVYVGAIPVFVDIESIHVPLMSVNDARAKCTARTKAVIIMHYAGYVADRESWRDFAASHGLRLIEDSAHAVGSARLPIFGDLAVFSFFGNKNMTTGEGGMILGNDASLIESARLGRSHGMTTSTVQRHNGEHMYDVASLGFNYRMDEFRAAIGSVQLSKLQNWNRKRKYLTHTYRAKFREVNLDLVLPFPEHPISSHHVFPVLLPVEVDRSDVMKRMRDFGVQTTWHYPPIHLLSWYEGRVGATCLPVTEEFAGRELTLPLHPKLDDADITHIVLSLRQVLNR